MVFDSSINTGVKKTFSTVDYVLFGLTLAISAGIGLFYAIKDKNKLNSVTYLLGNREMHVIPVAMSLLVTVVSALTLLGTPAEIYNYTTMFWWMTLSFVFAVVLAARVFIPFFYKLKLISVFQTIYMSFVLYAPSLALNAVTGFNLWLSILAVGIAVTLYTALGGMKAVLWTDTIQGLIIVAGLLAVLIQGSRVVGGFQNAWDIASNRSRIYFHDFSFNPTTRHSFWSIVVGGGFFWMVNYGINQAQVQRTISCPTLGKAQVALFVNLAGVIFILSMCCMIGIVMYAFYSDCHPLKFNNLISKTDQLMPLFVLDILGDIPGIPGMFVSCIFSGSLSSLSSCLNAFGAVIPHDLIQPYCCKRMSDRDLTCLSKTIVVVFGGLMIVIAFLVSRFGSVLQACMTLSGIASGPMFGLFILGMFFPWITARAALIGGITSLVFMLWVGFGAFVNKVSTATPSPVFVHGCNWNVTTSTILMTTTVTTMGPFNASLTTEFPFSRSNDPFLPLYSMSYLYYTPTAMAVMVIVAMIVSFITGKNDPTTLDPRLVSPLFDRLFPCLPECILRLLRCGVNHNKKYMADDCTDSPVQLDTKKLEARVSVGFKNTMKHEVFAFDEENGTLLSG